MNEKSFPLRPFATDSPVADIQTSGSVARNADALAVNYVLRGTLGEIVIQEPVDMPTREYNLWEETCLEFFLGKKGSGQYWEFNLSPSGHWNVFRFESYRQGMQDEKAFMSLPFNVQQESDTLLLALEIDLAKIMHADQSLEIGMSAVLQLIDGGMSYWALAHPCLRPDFHHRDSFIVAL